MNTKKLLVILGVGNVVAGSLLAAAVFQQTVGLQIALGGAGVMIACSVTFWCVTKLEKALRVLAKFEEADSNTTTGLTDFDQLCQQFTSILSSIGDEVQAHIGELDEVKHYLDAIDRRQEFVQPGTSSMRAKDRLARILEGYGDNLNSEFQQVVACGRELQRTIEELVSGSANQSDLVNNTTGFVEEMSAKLLGICDTADATLDASSDVQNRAEAGLKRFEDLVDEMKQVRNHASARERKLQTLGQHTKEIESIVQTIGSLSSRTDLLALNASIESVRAGEHGRGFAIVAEEVRTLAEQSAEAVHDIARRIEMIQLETNKSISVATGEHDQMNLVINQVTETLDSLRELYAAANQSKSGLAEISNESTRQLQLTQDIVFALEQSTDTSQANRSRAEGVHWTSKSLGELNEQVNKVLTQFCDLGAKSPQHEAPFSSAEPAASFSE